MVSSGLHSWVIMSFKLIVMYMYILVPVIIITLSVLRHGSHYLKEKYGFRENNKIGAKIQKFSFKKIKNQFGHLILAPNVSFYFNKVSITGFESSLDRCYATTLWYHGTFSAYPSESHH